ncbi:hypothetical protein ACLK1T_07430 [Escherichia coli]
MKHRTPAETAGGECAVEKRNRICQCFEAWILAGGAHHTVFSHALNLNDMRQFAEMQTTLKSR